MKSSAPNSLESFFNDLAFEEESEYSKSSFPQSSPDDQRMDADLESEQLSLGLSSICLTVNGGYQEIEPVIQEQSPHGLLHMSCEQEYTDWMSDPPSSSGAPSFSSDSRDQSCPSEGDTRSQDAPKKVGRKKNSVTNQLNQFRNLRKPFNVPKMEYLRIKTIRGFKRAIREVEAKNHPRTKLLGFQKRELARLGQWKQFCLMVRKNSRLQAIAPADCGPRTEGRSNRRREDDSEYRSFNEQCCREFFEDEKVRTAFRLYLDLVFVTTEEDDLRKKFNFSPVSETKEGRKDAWMQLRSYLYQEMFKDLGLESQL